MSPSSTGFLLVVESIQFRYVDVASSFRSILTFLNVLDIKLIVYVFRIFQTLHCISEKLIYLGRFDLSW